MEHDNKVCKGDSKLQFLYLCSIRIRSRNQVIIEKFSTTGMLQVSSLTIGGILGSKLASRVLPRVKSKTYTRPYLAAHRTVVLSFVVGNSFF